MGGLIAIRLGVNGASSAGLLASYPVPCPAFHHLQYGTANDGKLGIGLGTRLQVSLKMSCQNN